jgi:hypothetical protein
LLFSKHFNLQSGGRLAGVKREIKTETTGSFAYNFSVLKKVPEEPNFSVNRTAPVWLYTPQKKRGLSASYSGNGKDLIQ